jgi:tetratricopeptide (TPR) repeat protein
VSRSGAAWREHLSTVALVLLGLVLYARGLVLGLVGDDFTLLDAALRYPLGELLTGRHGIVGFYRPVSRELYFWWWGGVVGLGPGGFHLVNAATFAAVVVMILRLGSEWAGPRAGRLAAAAFVLFPPGSALLSWVSCAQDLIALFWALVALLLYRDGRRWPAALAVVLAALSKETAVVLPLVLLALDRQFHPKAPSRATLARLAPSVLGIAVAVAVAVAVRSTWPADTAVAVWSPRQLAGAWRLPLDFARTLFPPDTWAGIAQALASQPAMIVLVALLAAFAVPALRRTSSAAAAAGPGTRAATTAGSRTAAVSGTRVAAAPSPRAAGADRPLLLFGVSFALLALLPVGFVVERWRAYYFSLAGVGASFAAGVLIARIPAAAARTILALAALVNFGAGGIYRPVEAAWGPARHPHANYEFFRETGALSERLLAALEPWCESLRALPRTFAAGIPPEAAFESVLGPGLRVTCRDTVARVRFLADFTPADALTEFGVLRFEASAVRFFHERADARVRARIGQGFLIHGRYDVAAACFEAAAEGRPADRELSYPLVVALAAAGRGTEAERGWRAASTRGGVLDAATMAARLLGRATPAPDSELAALAPLAAAALRAPWEAGPHRALGRALLTGGRAREATFELAVAGGITHDVADLAWLAQGYEAMGALDEALAAYQRALSAGLPGELYDSTRTRFLALARRTGAALDRSRSGP